VLRPYRVAVLVLLPPSETKTAGGSGAALRVDDLPFTALTPVRLHLLDALAELAPADVARALKVSPALAEQVVLANRTVRSAATAPALDRYTGVLYAALLDTGLSRAERARADRRLLVTSALFGLVEAGSAIPAYRLSAGSALPGRPTVPAMWKPALTTVLAELPGPVVDLRSGSYAAFAPAPDALTVRVVTAGPDGRRLSVSHDNKATKGRLARHLATTRAEPADVPAVIRVMRRGGWTVEPTGPRSVDLVI
jgi:uncharacterized protein